MKKILLKEIAQQIRGVSYKPHELSAQNIEDFVPLLRAGNIGAYSMASLDDLIFVSEKNVASQQYLQSGDIMIVTSSGSLEIVGKSLYIEESQGLTFGAFCKVLRPNKDLVNPKYLSFYFQTEYYRKKISNLAQGANIKNLRNTHIDNLEIPFPDLETQNKIVTILDKAKTILEKREKTIRKYDELLKSIFIEMFGDVSNNPLQLPKKQLKEFGKIITGNTPPRSDMANYNSNFIEWIKTDNILPDTYILSQASEYLSEKGFKRARYVDEKSLLVACIAGSINSIGRSAITDRKVTFNQQINAIVPTPEVSVYFLYWMFKVSTEYIQSFATGGIKRLLTKGKFEKILFLKPSYEEQLRFEKIAVKYSDFILNVKKHQEEAENLLKSLSQQVFSEKIIIDIDAELETLVNSINLKDYSWKNRKAYISVFKTITEDITFLQKLIDKLGEQEFIDNLQYDKAKSLVFRALKKRKILKQVFIEKSKRIKLTI